MPAGSKPSPAGSLRESGRSYTSSRAAHVTRRWLVIGEVALSCVAIVGAGLFVRSFLKSALAVPADQYAITFVLISGEFSRVGWIFRLS
jgi:hypothetical protein